MTSTERGSRTATRLVASGQEPGGLRGRLAALGSRPPVAVIDLGSNSGRVVVLRIAPQGHLEILADGRSPLRLARDLTSKPRLTEEAIDRVVAALKDFTAIAAGSSARRVFAVATSAVREAENADRLLQRVLREAGVEVAVIDGRQEARYSFLGAVYGVNADDGILLDIGGGSMEASSFHTRQLEGSWTLPLGGLRLSAQFLRSDPPADGELSDLRDHIRTTLVEANLPQLGASDRLVGTGGTIRNLAKIDRESGYYPIPRIHGYVLTRERVADISATLRSRRSARRRLTPGLNADRADSIVGGAFATLVTMQTLGADQLIVSGQGLREGVFYDELGSSLPPVERVRQASVAALAARFASWDEGRARRRKAIALALLEALQPEARRGSIERLEHAATLLDIGRSIDFYRRHAHAADIVTESDLAGFSHRQLALLAAIIREAGEDGSVVRSYRPLLAPADRHAVSGPGAILALADEIERRMPPRAHQPVRCVVKKREVQVTAPLYDPYRQGILGKQFRRAFGRSLVIEPGMPAPEGSEG
jgi:exopolyphosphatase/guanosine-5'-triphosphate,3'-diphosphate pyrophosphatase